jgi:hypothetical protein
MSRHCGAPPRIEMCVKSTLLLCLSAFPSTALSVSHVGIRLFYFTRRAPEWPQLSICLPRRWHGRSMLFPASRPWKQLVRKPSPSSQTFTRISAEPPFPSSGSWVAVGWKPSSSWDWDIGTNNPFHPTNSACHTFERKVFLTQEVLFGTKITKLFNVFGIPISDARN